MVLVLLAALCGLLVGYKAGEELVRNTTWIKPVQITAGVGVSTFVTVAIVYLTGVVLVYDCGARGACGWIMVGVIPVILGAGTLSLIISTIGLCKVQKRTHSYQSHAGTKNFFKRYPFLITSVLVVCVLISALYIWDYSLNTEKRTSRDLAELTNLPNAVVTRHLSNYYTGDIGNFSSVMYTIDLAEGNKYVAEEKRWRNDIGNKMDDFCEHIIFNNQITESSCYSETNFQTVPKLPHHNDLEQKIRANIAVLSQADIARITEIDAVGDESFEYLLRVHDGWTNTGGVFVLVSDDLSRILATHQLPYRSDISWQGVLAGHKKEALLMTVTYSGNRGGDRVHELLWFKDKTEAPEPTYTLYEHPYPSMEDLGWE